MYLNSEQEKMLRGEQGWAVAKAMEILVKIGDALGALELVKITHAHVSGVSYSSIGKYGLEFILDFYARGGKAKVYTTINPGCIDYSGFSSVIDGRYLREQYEIDNALIGMGFKPVFTCIPYYYRPPLPGEHLAWGESSAVIYANSIYGAYTNREGGPVALASSITGYIYRAGLHLPENRVARVQINVSINTRDLPMGALGLWIGENVKEIPYIEGLRGIDHSDLKILLASMAASGNHALAVLDGITPLSTFSLDVREKMTIEKSDLDKYIGDEPQKNDRVLGYIGCPHLHPEELVKVMRLLRGYSRPRNGKLLITVPPEYVYKFKSVINWLRSRGVDVATGTCPVVSKFRDKYDVVVSNSGKALFYLKKIHSVKVRLAKLEEVIKFVY